MPVFYIQHAQQMIGKDVVDLAVDPPPDIVFEVDVTRKSHSKLSTYARFGVPEFWRYDGRRFFIYELMGDTYTERPSSVTFPLLKANDLERFLEQSRTQGQDAALDSIEEWIAKQPAHS